MLSSVSTEVDLETLDVFYTLDVDDSRLASFVSISGGDLEISVIRHNVVYETGEYREIILPGPTKYSPVVLEKGYGNTKELYNWFVQANTGRLYSARKNVTITLNVPSGGEYKALVAWDLIDAWPIKVSGFQSNQASSAQLARFSITLIAESIEREDP